MHELSICAAIVRIVDEAAAGRPVERVRLDVGYLRQVVPETLRYCWDITVKGTPLEAAELDIRHVPVIVECRSCGGRTEMTVLAFRCGSCQATDVTVVAGEELLVTSLDLVDA